MSEIATPAETGVASPGPLPWSANPGASRRRARDHDRHTTLTTLAQTVDVSALAHAVDAAAGGRVLVFGSPPPDGRDLDILARPEQCEAIASALADEGLVSMNGARWVAFARCTAAAVDLVDATGWHLADGELRPLLDEAQVLDGYDHLAGPSPPHALLIAARRVARA